MRFPLPMALLALWLGLNTCHIRADITFYSRLNEYILVTTPKTWDQAQADAVSRGGNLVRVNSAIENALILANCTGQVTSTSPDGGGTVYLWIGGKETATEGTYAWESGAATFWTGGQNGSASGGLYANWGRPNPASPYGGPEPDNFAGTQNRVAMALGKWPAIAHESQVIGNAGQWNDLNGSNALPYVIERPVTNPSEGIFATFTMTHGGRPAGSFTCQLFYDRAPKTVANFISLAEGTRAWMDPKSGISQKPFFTGLKLHRIIPDFMIQGGDPNGNGSGGPGYRFEDEFDPELRHDQLGVLSMANSGPLTNGSQFFVTVSEPTYLDGKHTVFGRVVEGYETVLALSRLPTVIIDKPDPTPDEVTSTPVEDIVIQSVTIQRIGADALSFNPLAQGLPKCEWQPVKFEMDAAGKHFIKWNDPPNVTYQLFNSPNLRTWESEVFTYYSGLVGGVAQSLETTAVPAAGDPHHFFRLARVVYQPYAPTTAPLRRFNLTGTKRGMSVTLTYTSATSATHNVVWTAPETPPRNINHTSTLSALTWGLSQFDAAFMTSDMTPPMPIFGTSVSHADWNFKFTSANGGTFTGGLYVPDRSQYLDESGTFTITTP